MRVLLIVAVVLMLMALIAKLTATRTAMRSRAPSPTPDSNHGEPSRGPPHWQSAWGLLPDDTFAGGQQCTTAHLLLADRNRPVQVNVECCDPIAHFAASDSQNLSRFGLIPVGHLQDTSE